MKYRETNPVGAMCMKLANFQFSLMSGALISEVEASKKMVEETDLRVKNFFD